jgi:hypothetical protein
MSRPDSVVAREAASLAFRGQSWPPVLTHKLPVAKFWQREVHELTSFKLTRAELDQIHDNVPAYTVVILPNQLCERRTGMVWGVITLSQLRFVAEKKYSVTPRMCKGPGAEHRAHVAQVVEAARVEKAMAEEADVSEEELEELLKKARARHRYCIKHGLRSEDPYKVLDSVLTCADGSKRKIRG